MRSFFYWLRSHDKRLSMALCPQKDIKIEGILFKIRKLNPLDYLAGYKAIQQSWTTYLASAESKGSETFNSDKIKSHYVDVFTAAVIEPKLTRKTDDESIKDSLNVDCLFNNWSLCQRLYDEIMLFTYGKKKLRLFGFLKKS